MRSNTSPTCFEGTRGREIGSKALGIDEAYGIMQNQDNLHACTNITVLTDFLIKLGKHARVPPLRAVSREEGWPKN